MSNQSMEAQNKTLALILWGKDSDGEDDVAVFPGTLIKENDLYYLQRGRWNKPGNKGRMAL